MKSHHVEVPPPRGLTLATSSPEHVIVSHQRQYSLSLLVSLWIMLFACGSASLWITMIEGQKFLFGPLPATPIHQWFPLGFWGFTALCLLLIGYYKGCNKTIFLEPNLLTIETRLWGIRWSEKYMASEIQAFKQIQDGGQQIQDGGGGLEEDSSFPTWGLRIIINRADSGEQRRTLLSRELRSQSEWLGQVLAKWYGVPYQPAANDQN